MEVSFNVEYQEKSIGKCTLERQGLYWKIICRCSDAVEGFCRLMLECGSDTVDLGILVPVNGGFGLEKRIPVKRLTDGEMRFYIQSCVDSAKEFVPVRTGEPFSFLSRLEGSRFERRNGQSGIRLTVE